MSWWKLSLAEGIREEGEELIIHIERPFINPIFSAHFQIPSIHWLICILQSLPDSAPSMTKILSTSILLCSFLLYISHIDILLFLFFLRYLLKIHTSKMLVSVLGLYLFYSFNIVLRGSKEGGGSM